MLTIEQFEELSKYPFCKASGISVPHIYFLCKNGCNLYTWFKRDEEYDSLIDHMYYHDVITMYTKIKNEELSWLTNYKPLDDDIIYRDAHCNCSCGCTVRYKCGYLNNKCIYDFIIRSMCLNIKFDYIISEFNKLIDSIEPDVYKAFCEYRKNIILEGSLETREVLKVDKKTGCISYTLGHLSRKLINPDGEDCGYDKLSMLCLYHELLSNPKNIRQKKDSKYIEKSKSIIAKYLPDKNNDEYMTKFLSSDKNIYDAIHKELYDIKTISTKKMTENRISNEKKLLNGIKDIDYIEAIVTNKDLSFNYSPWHYDYGYYDRNTEIFDDEDKYKIDSYICGKHYRNCDDNRKVKYVLNDDKHNLSGSSLLRIYSHHDDEADTDIYSTIDISYYKVYPEVNYTRYTSNNTIFIPLNKELQPNLVEFIPTEDVLYQCDIEYIKD